mgnify:FL=1
MNKLFCRAFQGVMKVGNYFVGYRTPELLEGPGCIGQLPALLAERGARRVLLVTGRHITKSGLNAGLIEGLKAAGIAVTVFTDLAPDPSSDDVERGYALCRAEGCDTIIAFGGGSPMDCAKAIAARLARPDRTVAQLQGLLKVRRPILPFYAVPTTAGTGSETTIAAVIADSATHHKAAINDPALIPLCAVLDPELTVGLPPFTTGTTGMDALCHAVEAYTNHIYNTRLEDDMALQAVKLIYENLLPAYRDGADLAARQNMQRAAFYAGRAFTRGGVGYVHAVGHAIGSLYGVSHGLAMAVILPHVMRQFGPAARRRLAELAEHCGIPGADEGARAEAFLRWMEETDRAMDLPAGLDMIRDEDVEQIIAWAMAEANPLYPVPAVWGREDFRQLIRTLRTAR